MKLTSIEIHPDGSSDVLLLSFRDPSGLNPYNVKDIKGLDADEIIPQYLGSPGGSPSYHLLQDKRVIVLKMGLNPNFSAAQTFSDIRDDVYKMIASSRKGKVQLQFKDNNAVVAAINGYIGKFESERFAVQQEVQLTIFCDTTMLTALDEVMVDVTDLNEANTFIMDDLSTAPHGFTFALNVIMDTPSIQIFNPDDVWRFEVVPTAGFEVGDVLYFSNEEEKQLFIIRPVAGDPPPPGTLIQLAESITPGSAWPMMFPGTNHFKFVEYSSVAWKAISYHPTYWGV
jgi:hypothetical protein